MVPSSLAIIVAAFASSERGGAIGSLDGLGRDRGHRRAAGRRPDRRPNCPGAGSSRSTCRSSLGTLTLVSGSGAGGTGACNRRRVDFIGAALVCAGCPGIVFALIEQPHFGWSSPVIFLPLVAREPSPCGLLGIRAAYRRPMLELELFSRRNFAFGNVETFSMYAGLGDPVLLSRSFCSRSPATARSRVASRSFPLPWSCLPSRGVSALLPIGSARAFSWAPVQ